MQVPQPRAEIWIRQVGNRRQAFYRCRDFNRKFARWQKMSVPEADKALKAGTLDMGFGDVLPTVPRETVEQVAHPMAAEFAAQAKALNSQIEALGTRAAA